MNDIENAQVNEHCLNNIVRLSQSKPVTAAEDIYDHGGVKLWAKDAVITPELQQRLLSRKLRKPLEATLRVADGVTKERIVAEAQRLYDEMPAVACLMGTHQAAVLETLSLVRLDPAATLLLTSAAENSGGFSHAVLVSLIAVAIGNHIGRSGMELMTLAVAGLLHDVGELYLNPDYLNVSRRLSANEWKHVAVHPRVGEMVLTNLGCYPNSVTRAVAEHHERFDGNGYPRQIPGEKISVAGQVLGIAEMLSGILARKDNAISRACLALKLVPGEHPHKLVSVLATIEKLSGHSGTRGLDGSLNDPLRNTEKIAASLTAAIAESSRILDPAQPLPGQAQDLALRLQYRLRTLQQALRATGIQHCAEGTHPLDTLRTGNDALDESIALELEMVGREIGWRLRDMARELGLRINEAPEELASTFSSLLALLDAND